jgi:hypothetical protein
MRPRDFLQRLLTVAIVASAPAIALAVKLDVPLSATSFHDFTPGASVDRQGGWSVLLPGQCGPYDESIASFQGNAVWRVSNAVTCESFEDHPFAPRPGGIPADTINTPDNGEPSFFAGESSTGAALNGFVGRFSFRSATGAPQPGLRITVSADSGRGARQSFLSLFDTGDGIDVQTYDVDRDGNFIGERGCILGVTIPCPGLVISARLSYTAWHTVETEVRFNDGPRDDRVRIFIDDRRVHQGESWEEYYRNFEGAQHPRGVPVQTLTFRISGSPAPAVLGGGYYIDNVFTGLFSGSPTPPPTDGCVYQDVTYAVGEMVEEFVNRNQSDDVIAALEEAGFVIDAIEQVANNRFRITATCQGP